MKVLLVTHTLSWSIGTLARLLALRPPPGWEVTILSQHDREENPARVLKRAADSDVVHWMSHGFARYPERALPDRVRQTAGVMHVEARERPEDLERLGAFDGLLVLNTTQRDALAGMGIPAERIVCVPIPVDDAFFGNGRRGPRQLRPGRPLRIGLFCSAQHDSDRKGLDLLPDVAGGLRERGLSIELVVTGPGWERLLATPAFRACRATFVLVPSYFDMPAIYRRIDLYLCLSTIEGGPMPVFEALASGVPVVSTEVGQIPDLLVADADYARIPPRNSLAAVETIARVAGEYAQWAEAAGRAAERIQPEISLDRYRERMADFLGGAAGKVAPPPASVRRRLREWWQRRIWRGRDWVFWGKECWARGLRIRGLGLMAGGLWLNPCAPEIWRIVGRRVCRG